MYFYLMHKNNEVAVMDIDSDGKLSRVKITNQDLVPLGGKMNNMKFHNWWSDRAVPKTRKGVAHALRELGYTNTSSFLVNNLALSLNDCYWIKPTVSSISWESINLFNNNFIDIFGDLTFNTKAHLSNVLKNTLFRCASSQGELQKKWCIDNNGLRFLVKGNWGSSFQQSLNEVFASELHRLQNFKLYTPYYLTSVRVEGDLKGLGCYSYNFCNENVESISAWEVLQLIKLKQNETWFYKFKDLCISYLGFTEGYFHQYMDYLIETDFLLSNTDRHMNNIAVLRDSNTLKYLGFSPIYDTGNSMFFRNNIVPINNLLSIKTHSFTEKEVNLLKYVRNREIVNLNLLPSKDYFYNLYSKDIPERLCRLDDMWSAFNKKVDLLNKFQTGKDIYKFNMR